MMVHMVCTMIVETTVVALVVVARAAVDSDPVKVRVTLTARLVTETTGADEGRDGRRQRPPRDEPADRREAGRDDRRGRAAPAAIAAIGR